MPYIKKEKRAELDSWINMIWPLIAEPGDLTYVICRLMWRLWQTDQWGRNFTTWTMLRSAVEEAVSDFWKRIIEPYEEKQMMENGDVYTD